MLVADSSPKNPSGQAPDPASDEPTVEVGTRLGERFTVMHRLGAGGLGKVYLAHDAWAKQDVALKFWRPSKSRSTDARLQVERRNRKSIAKAQRITHPRVCRIYDVHHFGGFEFVAMEFVPGKSLRQIIDEEGALDPARVLRFGIEICEGLQATHRNGWFHQDIKPSNLIVDLDDGIKITDFDIVGSSWRGATLYYASPEQILGVRKGVGKPGAASDLFAVGCVLYEAVTGQRAYPNGGVTSSPDPKNPTHYVPDLPSRLVDAVSACLQRDPKARPQSATDLIRILQGDAARRPPLEPGTVLEGRFRIERALGQGNSGVVFRAKDLTLDQQVALKFWNPDNVLSEPSEDVKREMRIAKELPGHDRLCRVFGFYDHGAYAFAVLELVQGGDLKARIERQGRLQPIEVLRLAVDLCEGLAVIHKAGLVHQDIEPGNLLLDEKGRLKIADLGFAGRERWWGRNLPYASPEQLRALEREGSGSRAEPTPGPTPASDLFAVGCVIYEMLTGAQAFPDGSLATFHPVPASRFFPDVPERLDRAVRLCLDRDPTRRPASAVALEQILSSLLEASSEAVPAPQASDSGDSDTSAPTDVVGEVDGVGDMPELEAIAFPSYERGGSLSRLTARILDALEDHPLVMLSLQEHQDPRAAVSLLLNEIRSPESRWLEARHLVLPASRNLDLPSFFERLAVQCRLSSVGGADGFERALHRRLSDRGPLFLVLSGWADGPEEARLELGHILQNLSAQFDGLQAVLIGGEPLARLKYAGEGHRLLENAKQILWPEFDVEDVIRLARQDFQELDLDMAAAEGLLRRCGGHYRLLRRCLQNMKRGEPIGDRLFVDQLYGLFTPFRKDEAQRHQVLEWLEINPVGPYDPWPEDAALRRLFWSGALADRGDAFEWRSPEFQRVGRQALAGGGGA